MPSIQFQRARATAVFDSRIEPHEVGDLGQAVQTPDDAQELLNLTQDRALTFLHNTRSELSMFARNVLAEGGGTVPSALTLLAERLLDAEVPGLLTAGEITEVEERLSAQYGATAAREAIEDSLGTRIASLDESGASLAQDYGSLGGHIARTQMILQAHLSSEFGNGKLIDANFNGKLDSDDVVWTADAQGLVNTKKIGGALRDQVQVERAIIDACYEMHTHPHEFALIKDHTCNTALWTLDGGGGSFRINTGVKPSDAVMDIFDNAPLYQFECATAMIIVYYRAMLDLLGAKDFDQVVGDDLVIGPWRNEDSLGRVMKYSGDQVDGTPEQDASITPGTYGYFRNWDVSDEARAGGWQGENVICLGRDDDGEMLFYGHPFGVATGPHITEFLNTQRKADATRSAELLAMRGTIDPSVLDAGGTHH